MRQFELTIVRFDPEPTSTQATFESRQEAVAALTIPKDTECFVRVSEMENNVCWGEFELWCSHARARARILEHREHDGRDPNVIAVANAVVEFRDEDGAYFSAPFEETVPKALAISAIRAWLEDAKHPKLLQWT